MQVNEDGFDLSAAERFFGTPPIPLWPESDIDGDPDRVTFASYHSPECNCGRPEGICYDLDTTMRYGGHPNKVLLHELTHAWQYHRDPDEDTVALQTSWKREYGYEDCPHEREARAAASVLHERGLQVWFPELIRGPERLDPVALMLTAHGF